MRCLSMLAAGLIAATVPTARAEEWPERGFYRVQSEREGAERLCRLHAEVSVNGLPFAFIVNQLGTRSWTAQLLAQDARIAQARRVIVGFDREGVFEFTPKRVSTSPEISSVAGEIADGDDAMADLRQAATAAKWLQIEAAPYTQVIPAAGMSEALDDLAACRMSRRL